MTKLARLMGLGILGLALAVGVGNSGDAKKDKDKDKEKIKHSIPAGWKALKLTADQKKQVYSIQDEYQPKILEARRKVAQLEAQEKVALIRVLTPEQKAQLIGEEPKDKASTKDAKPDTKDKGGN
jgi:Spy/CpxP family protein refolding chaperone